MPQNKSKHYRSGLIRKTPNNTWTAELPRDATGKRPRKRFKTEGAAKMWIDTHQTIKESSLPELTSTQIIQAARAIEILGQNANLIEAATYYKNHGAIKTVTLSECIQGFLAAKQTGNLRPKTLSTYRTETKMFLEKLGDIPLSEITPERIESIDWGCSKNTSIRTHINHLGILLSWAAKRRWIGRNPIQSIQKIHRDDTPPATFTIHQIAALLIAAKELHPRILAEYAIGIFAGIRPDETSRTQWKHIGETHIEITAQASKTRDRRYIEITPTLRAWLDLCPDREPEHRITRGMSLHRKQEKNRIRETAGITEWPQDVLRHCAASYHYALHQDAARTAAMLGHVDQKMLFRHYRNLITEADGMQWRDLTPANADKLMDKQTTSRISREKKKPHKRLEKGDLKKK